MSIANYAPATNSVLRALPRKDGQRLLARHEQVKLSYGDILCEPGKRLGHVYFPNSGIISLLTPVDGRPCVEVGLVGREGMAGMALFLGVGVSPVRMLVQGQVPQSFPARSFCCRVPDCALGARRNHPVVSIQFPVPPEPVSGCTQRPLPSCTFAPHPRPRRGPRQGRTPWLDFGQPMKLSNNFWRQP